MSWIEWKKELDSIFFLTVHTKIIFQVGLFHRLQNSSRLHAMRSCLRLAARLDRSVRVQYVSKNSSKLAVN